MCRSTKNIENPTNYRKSFKTRQDCQRSNGRSMAAVHRCDLRDSLDLLGHSSICKIHQHNSRNLAISKKIKFNSWHAFDICLAFQLVAYSENYWCPWFLKYELTDDGNSWLTSSTIHARKSFQACWRRLTCEQMDSSTPVQLGKLCFSDSLATSPANAILPNSWISPLITSDDWKANTALLLFDSQSVFFHIWWMHRPILVL